ncbi:hypothetical protein ACXR0M_10565 [Pseudomonas sp. Eth.TT006]
MNPSGTSRCLDRALSYRRRRVSANGNPRYFGRTLRKKVIHSMNQKRTRVPLPHPPPYRQSRISFWLMVLVGVLIAFLIGASIYLIAHSLSSGSITTWNRSGPRHTYTLALQPRMFWFEIVSQCVGTVFLIAVGWIGLWMHRMAREPSDKKNGKRAQR